MASLVGAVLSGRFRVVKLLGSGAMGDVYLADHTTLHRQYAIKVLRESVETDERMVERFRREARAASRLDHPNIVSIADFGRTDVGGAPHGHRATDRLFLVMEYVPGESLMEAIDGASPGRIPVARSVSIVRQLCAAVKVAHNAGVVHRDLKPDNVILGRGPSGQDHVKVLDFGLAKLLQDPELSQLTSTGEIFGSPAYMSPEQALGREVDTRADLYAMGAMAYELFSGRLPFDYPTIPRLLIAHQKEIPTPPSRHVPQGESPIPREIEAVILQCLEKEPARRPQTVAELLALFAACEQRLSVAGTKVIPRVVVQEPEDASSSEDWCEVTYDAGEGDVMATLFGSGPATLGEGGDPAAPPDGPDTPPPESSREWFWSQVLKRAKPLASFLWEQRLVAVEVAKVLAQANDFEERTVSLETEVALAQSRIEELGTLTHEAESQLRYAVMDLSMERGRLTDLSRPNPTLLQDLDFQIQSLEGRLSELYRQRAEKLHALEKSIVAREKHLVVFRKKQVDAEARLLNLLHRVRPSPCPEDLQVAYQRIGELLQGMERAG